MEALARDLVSDAPAGLTKAWFTCGGSESIEAALKLTRQYFVETGQPGRRHVIGRMQSYHGTTAGALSAGGNIGRRAVFEPLLLGAMHHISPCFAYRGQRAEESEAQYGERVANELETKILELGTDTVAAFIAETVVGSTLGCVTPAKGYFKRIREICDKYGVLLILDEVMCGMGRTGRRYACEDEGIAPDFIALAKGLSAGSAWGYAFVAFQAPLRAEAPSSSQQPVYPSCRASPHHGNDGRTRCIKPWPRTSSDRRTASRLRWPRVRRPLFLRTACCRARCARSGPSRSRYSF